MVVKLSMDSSSICWRNLLQTQVKYLQQRVTCWVPTLITIWITGSLAVLDQEVLQILRKEGECGGQNSWCGILTTTYYAPSSSSSSASWYSSTTMDQVEKYNFPIGLNLVWPKVTIFQFKSHHHLLHNYRQFNMKALVTHCPRDTISQEYHQAFCWWFWLSSNILWHLNIWAVCGLYLTIRDKTALYPYLLLKCLMSSKHGRLFNKKLMHFQLLLKDGHLYTFLL